MSTADEIKVYSIPKKGRKHWYYRWEDLKVPGRRGECSSGFTTKAKADEGKPAFRTKMIASRPAADTTWEEFCNRYETEYLKKKRPSTRTAWQTAKNRFEEIAKPTLLREVDYSKISDFAGKLRGTITDASVETYLRTLRVALNEAGRLYPSYEPPKISVESCDPRVRPLTEDELKAFLEAAEAVVGADHAASWKFGIRLGAWTGLRRNQLIRLSWDQHAPIRIEGFGTDDPRIVITVEESKGKREHYLRLMPPAIAILNERPERERYGRVWKPLMTVGGKPIVQETPSEIGRKVARMGEKAGIVTGTRLLRQKDGTVIEGPKYASLHDMKATFIRRMEDRGFKLSEIMLFAQHTDVKVTMHYLKKGTVSRGRVDELFAQHDHKEVPKTDDSENEKSAVDPPQLFTGDDEKPEKRSA